MNNGRSNGYVMFVAMGLLCSSIFLVPKWG